MHPFARQLPSAFAIVALAIPSTLSACSSTPTGGVQPPEDSGGGGDDGGTTEAGSEAGGGDGGGGGSATCPAGSKTGTTMPVDAMKTAMGLTFNVRIPPSYSPTVGSPVLVLYAEQGPGATFDEMDTGITPVAFSHGYIVAYADHWDQHSTAEIQDAATIFTEVGKKWCVDPKRFYAAGNSDGGTETIEIAQNRDQFMPSLPSLAAIAPSAAAADGPTLMNIPCSAGTPISAFIMHSTQDGTFPVASGRAQAAWYAKCDGCGATPSLADKNGCVSYPNCMGVSVVYCEGNLLHAQWPGNSACPGPGSDCLNEPIFKFFDAHRLP